MSERLTKEQWWKTHSVNMSDASDGVKTAFREIALNAWDAALLAAPQAQREAVDAESAWNVFLENVRVSEGLDSTRMNFLGDAGRYKQSFIHAVTTAAPASSEAKDARRYGYVVREGLIDGYIDGYLEKHDMEEAGYPGTPEYKKLADAAIDDALSREGLG